MGFTLLCVTDCVFLKFNHFLFKNAFRIKCRLRKTTFLLNWIVQYFALKPEFYRVLHHFLLRTASSKNLTISCLKMRFASSVG